MNKQFILFILFLCAFFTAKGQEEKIKFTEFTLDNGLHVILHHDDTTPNVMVSIMYHVGSKNEDPERTGFAHLFEHLMFEGSENIGRGEFDKLVQAAGGTLNANTSFDRTFYFINVPSNELELALWMEAERMFHARIDTIGVNTQKNVVIEERKQNYDNRPYGTAFEEMLKRTFIEHPYRWSVIGDPEHIRSSTFKDVYNFYQTFYVPNNAVLVVAGDFDKAQAKEWIEKYFGSIPRGTLPIYRPNIQEPAQTEAVRDTVYDNIQLSAVFIAFRGPAAGTKEAYAMDLLTDILSSGKSARMTSNLDEKGLTARSGMYYLGLEDSGIIYAFGFANLGRDIKEVEDAILAEIERVRTELVSEEEFQMVQAAAEYSMAAQLRTLAGVSQALAFNHIFFNDANRINKELSFYGEITREDLLHVAQKYLQPQSKIVIYFLPKVN